MTNIGWPKSPWEDPLLLNEFLDEEERIIQKQAYDFAQKELMPGILEANRHEKFDLKIFNKMGKK